MSIAEKLTQIAENQQGVYDAGKKASLKPFELEYNDTIYTSPYALCDVITPNPVGSDAIIELENLTDKNIRVWLRVIDILDGGIVDDIFNFELDFSAHEKLELVENNGRGIRSAFLMGATFI